MNLTWYARRLSRMSVAELALRSRDNVIKLLWRSRRLHDVLADGTPVPHVTARFATPLPPGARESVDPSAREALVACADRLLAGEWPLFAIDAVPLGSDPDWFADPRTGRRAPDSHYSFGIDHREEEAVGNIKYVWEISRHHHLTVLAAAYHITGDQRYARRVAEHLTSWWRRNPFLSGVHWTSGIEIGVRLVSWVWVRRLLDSSPMAADLFERNPLGLRQLAHHQRYLATLRSHSSSANNHLIAEAAGLFAAACAFPWFPESGAWRVRSASILRREIAAQTFASGPNREQAFGYHGFVLELALAAALEGEAAGFSLGVGTWDILRRMTDSIAAVADARLGVPRHGDSDDASGLLLDDPAYDRWSALLSTGACLFGALPWWPEPRRADVRTALWSALAHPPENLTGPRPSQRPSLFADAGMAILRDHPGVAPEIWCRCDHGPLGYLSLAAHGHADALAVELRHDGVDVLCDPGTYCYHGEPEWRAYFRSTLGHNTLEVAGVSQVVDGGPFLWLRPPRSQATQLSGLDHGAVAVWEAEHDGYARLDPPAVHRRRVEFDRDARTIAILDRLECEGVHPCRLAFHLGEQVSCELVSGTGLLSWRSPGGTMQFAQLELPAELEWSAVRGQTDPPLGWYSPSFDEKRPTTTLLGVGHAGFGRTLRSVIRFERPTPRAGGVA